MLLEDLNASRGIGGGAPREEEEIAEVRARRVPGSGLRARYSRANAIEQRKRTLFIGIDPFAPEVCVAGLEALRAVAGTDALRRVVSIPLVPI
jgi:hypothetical protein